MRGGCRRCVEGCYWWGLRTVTHPRPPVDCKWTNEAGCDQDGLGGLGGFCTLALRDAVSRPPGLWSREMPWAC